MAFPLARLLRRHLSTAGAAAAAPLLTGGGSRKSKSRATLSLLKSEKDPDRILDICRAAALSPTTSTLDRTALSIAVSKLSTAGALPSIRSLLNDLLLADPRLRSHAITLFGRANMLPDAVNLFALSPNLTSLNALLSACLLARNHAEAARIFHQFPNSYSIQPNLDTYNTVIKAFCESGSSHLVYKVLDEMRRAGINPNPTTLCTALAGFYSEERFGDVDAILDLMKKSSLNCHSDLATYNVRIQSLCKLKRSGDAKALFKEMHSVGTKPNWVTYSNLVVGFCKEGDLEEAKKLYKEMRTKGCIPDSSFYFTLINYLCQGEQFEAALAVCKETMDRNWFPCFSTMKMLVNGLVSEYMLGEARGIIQRMKQKFPKNAEMWKEVENGLLP